MASPGSLSDDDDCFFDSRDRIASAASSRQSSHNEPRAGELPAPQLTGRTLLHAPAVSGEATRVAEAPAELALSGGETCPAATPPPLSEPAAPPATLPPAASPQPAVEAAMRPEAVTEAPEAATIEADAQPAVAHLPSPAPSPAPAAAPEASPPLAEAVAAALEALAEAVPPAAVADAPPLFYAAERHASSYDTAPATAEPSSDPDSEPLVLQWSPPAVGQAAASAPHSAAPGNDPAAGKEPNLEVSMAHLRAMMLAMTSTIAGLERATAGMALSSEAPRSGESAYGAPELQPVPEAAPACVAVPAASAVEKAAPVKAAPVAKAESPAAPTSVATPALAPVKTASAEAVPVKAFAAELASLGLSEREIETLSVVKGSGSDSDVAEDAADAKPRTTSEIAMAKIVERAAQSAAAKSTAPAAAPATTATSTTAASALGKKTTAAVAKAPPVSTLVAKPASSKPAPNLSEITPQPVQAARPAAEVMQQRQSAPPAAPDWAAWADAVAASSFAARVPATGAAAHSLADALAGLDARVARAAAAAAARTAGTCLSGPAHAQLAAVNAAQAALAAQAAEVLRSSSASWTASWASSFATSPPSASPPAVTTAVAASALPSGAEPLPCARFASGCDSGALLVWRADAYAPLAQRTDAHTGALRCLSAVPGAPGRLASGGDDGALRLWALPGAVLGLDTTETPKEQAPVPAGSADAAHAGPVTALCALRGAPAALVTGGADGALRLWALGADGALPSASEPLQPPLTSGAGDALAPLAHAGGVVAVAALVAPCAFVFASAGSTDRTVRFWARASSGGAALVAQAHANAGAHAAPLAALAALPAGRLASASSDGTVWLWSVTGAPARRLQCTAAGPVAATHLAPLRHGRLAVGCGDATLRLLDTDADRDDAAAALQAHAGPVAAATPLASGGVLATAGADGSLVFWLPPRAGSAADEPPLNKRRVVSVPQHGAAITTLLALDA